MQPDSSKKFQTVAIKLDVCHQTQGCIDLFSAFRESKKSWRSTEIIQVSVCSLLVES